MKRFLQMGLLALAAMLGYPASAFVPSFSPSTTLLEFGSFQTLTTSPEQTIIVTNRGLGALTVTAIGISGPNAGDYAIVPEATNCLTLGTVAAGGTCTISLTFTPQGTGSSNATLSVTDNASGSPQAITLNGDGTPAPVPVLALSATTLAFGPDPVGTVTPSQTLTVNNTGAVTLDVTGVGLGGTNPVDFTIVGDNCTGTMVAPDASCTVSVTFTAGATGARQASLDITSNDANSPAQVGLSGTGTVVTVPAAGLTPPGPLSFGNVNLGVTSATQTVTLTDTGTASLSITNIQVAGPGFVQSSTTCGASLAPGVSCAVGIAFAPTAGGLVSGSLTVTSNDPAGAAVVSFSGTGIDPPPPSPASVALTPASLKFDARHVHTTGKRPIQVTNTGTGPLSLTAVNISGPQAADFREQSNCPIGGTLAPQKSCTIWVSFTPADTGTRSATLTLSSNASGSNTVSLSGIGTRRCAKRHDHHGDRDHDGDKDDSIRHWWEAAPQGSHGGH